MHVLSRYHTISAAVVFVAALALIGCGGDSGSDSSDPLSERTWTYMVYMAADNNLSAYAHRDVNEMETVGSGGDVNIVVQVEFSSAFKPDFDGHTLRGGITRDDDFDVINSGFTDIGSQDMTDPQTLAAFIAWAAEYYPAQHYALVVWSHGDGWKNSASSLISKGLISDSSDAPGELMPLQDLAGAIDSSDVGLDLINFDTCLMGMYEVAYELGGLADYLAFSEGLYPCYGDAYDAILQVLTISPDMDGQELAQVITAESVGYYESYEIEVAKSSVDEAYIDDLHDGLCLLAGFMIDNMDSEGPNIQSARDDSLSYYYPENHDLGDFLEKLNENTANEELKAAIQQVQATMADLVISNEVYSSVPGDEILRSQGLAVYLPTSAQVDAGDLGEYERLACNQTGNITWKDFLESLMAYDETTP